jgi:protease I
MIADGRDSARERGEIERKDRTHGVQAVFRAGKPAAVICHGPWTLVEADLVRGRRLTSWPSLRTDIRNAGGEWVDAEVQRCTSCPNILVTSRRPDDLPAFWGELVAQFASARS